MNFVNSVLDIIRNLVRTIMKAIAHGLNKLTGGRIHPNVVTLTGLFAHIPIAWLIAAQKNILAAIMLVIFGLFDTLDGELARLQKRTSVSGMLLDSITDRMKEVLLYCGVAYAAVAVGRPYMSFWAVAACGTSLLVSYVNAWGEVVAGPNKQENHSLNKSFRSGLMSFEIRMVVLLLGLLSGRLILATIIVAILSALTAVERLIRISRALNK